MLKIKLSPSSVGAVIYQPVDLEPIGGIVLLHGSEGGSAGKIDIIAALLAAHGFLAMPKPYNKADALLTRPADCLTQVPQSFALYRFCFFYLKVIFG